MELKGNIRVFVRLRPVLPEEKTIESYDYVNKEGSYSVRTVAFAQPGRGYLTANIAIFIP